MSVVSVKQRNTQIRAGGWGGRVGRERAKCGWYGSCVGAAQARLLSLPGFKEGLFPVFIPSRQGCTAPNQQRRRKAAHGCAMDWEEKVDPKGTTYYVNHATQATQWDRPAYVKFEN